MVLILKHVHGIIATEGVAYAKEKPIWNRSYRRRAGGINQAGKQVYVTVFYGFTRQDDSPCHRRTPQ